MDAGKDHIKAFALMMAIRKLIRQSGANPDEIAAAWLGAEYLDSTLEADEQERFLQTRRPKSAQDNRWIRDLSRLSGLRHSFARASPDRDPLFTPRWMQRDARTHILNVRRRNEHYPEFTEELFQRLAGADPKFKRALERIEREESAA